MKVNSKLNGFGQGTMVLMADGSEKAIEKIKAGDKVLSFNQLDAFAPLEVKRVLDVASRVDRGALEVILDDKTLKVAPGQLFINASQDWHRASSINEVIDQNGNVCNFTVKQIKTGKHAIYDIIVEDNHSLIANGVRVHNMLYSQADVIAGRMASAKYDSPGRTSSEHGSDYDNDRYSYSSGRSRKKKSLKASKRIKASRRSNTLSYAKPDDISVASKLLGSMGDLTELLTDIINAATPATLNTLKLTAQSSVDNIVSYTQSYLASILNVSTSVYDKSEMYQWGLDIMQAAIDARKPFEETVVSASGKSNALNLLAVINLNILRSQAKLKVYTTNDDKGDLDVKTPGSRTSSTRNGNKLPGRNGFGKDPHSNGQYKPMETGGSNRQSSLGPQSGGGGSTRSSGAGSSTRSTGGKGGGFGGLGGIGSSAVQGAIGGALSGGGLKGAAMGAVSSVAKGAFGGGGGGLGSALGRSLGR